MKSRIHRIGAIVSIIVVAAMLGIALQLQSHAQTASLVLEPEQGTLSAGAALQADPLASGGQAVRFGSAAAAAHDLVTACGTQFCQNGMPWYLYGASIYGFTNSLDQSLSIAQSAKLNTVRLTDFLNTSGAPATASYDEASWQKVDAAIAAASQKNMKVILDLSTYRNLLKQNNINPYTYDWQPFLKFVTSRVNTVSHQTYATDPTIAVIALAGEAEPPNGGTDTNPLRITGPQLTSFYSRSLAELAALDTSALRTTGGFLQLDWNSGIDWQTIMQNPNDQICEIHNYETPDSSITTPNVSQYCASLHKPWMTEEFGYNGSIGDSTRAADFQAMYSLQTQYKAAGVSFWNIGPQTSGNTYDVNSGTPLTYSVVQKNAP